MNIGNFKQMLSETGNALLVKRADQIAQIVEMEQQSLVNNLKKEKFGLENELASLTDLSVRTSDSLTLASKSFNPSEFVSQVQNLKVKLRNKEIELKLAQDTYDEWFKEED